MFDAATIQALFKALDEELSRIGVVGEVGICGGAVMCLVFEARKSTKDVDAVFQPAAKIRQASRRVARRMGVDEGWLNDAAKGFFYSDPPKQAVLDLPHLRVWAPTADYMLAMKCLAARFDTHDKEDVELLIERLWLTTPEQVFELVAKYCPKSLVPAKTQFFVEELFSGS